MAHPRIPQTNAVRNELLVMSVHPRCGRSLSPYESSRQVALGTRRRLAVIYISVPNPRRFPIRSHGIAPRPPRTATWRGRFGCRDHIIDALFVRRMAARRRCRRSNSVALWKKTASPQERISVECRILPVEFFAAHLSFRCHRATLVLARLPPFLARAHWFRAGRMERSGSRWRNVGVRRRRFGRTLGEQSWRTGT